MDYTDKKAKVEEDSYATNTDNDDQHFSLYDGAYFSGSLEATLMKTNIKCKTHSVPWQQEVGHVTQERSKVAHSSNSIDGNTHVVDPN